VSRPVDPEAGSERLSHTGHDAWTLLRTEIRVRVRSVLADRRKLLGTASSVAVFGLVAPWFFREGVTAFADRAASGAVPVGGVGGAFATLAFVGLTVGASTGFRQERAGRVGPLVRTSVSPTAVSLARLASELLRGLTVFLVPIGAVVAFLWAGAGGPLLPAALVVGALPLVVAALLVGRLAGDAVRYLNRTVGVSLWVKAALAVVVSLAFFIATTVLLFPETADSGDEGSAVADVSVPVFLPGEPLQAYGSVVTAPVGGTADPLGWTVAGAVLVAVPVCLVAALRVETRLLFRESSGERAGESVAGTTGVPGPFAVGPGPRVAWRYLLRTRRDPRVLSHLMVVFFVGIGSLGNVVREPESAPSVVPPVAVVGGAVIAGAAYCMNPLGDDVDQLPLLLTSTGSTDVVLRGRAIAGAALGLPLALGVGVPLAAVDRGPLLAAWLAVLAVPLVFGGTGVALGLGALVPKFEQYEYMSVERPHPSNYVIFGYLFGTAVVGGIGFLLVVASASGGATGVVGVAWAVYLAVVVGLGIGGYAYAKRRFEDLSVDEF